MVLFAKLQSYGIEVAPYFIVRKEADVERAVSAIGYPLVVKLASGEHKTDIGGVVTNIYTEEMLYTTLAYFRRKFKNKPLLFQKQINEGIEVYVGIKRDENFGNVIVLGLGGIYVEVFKDISARICPIREEDVYEMVEELKSRKVLLGYRGEGVNIEALAKLMVRLCRFARVERIMELDLNPVKVSKRAAVVLDARVAK
ncbi:MAG: acetyl-CoA synthetase [Methanobacteriota archaeon]|nr:MAG: acetyl-CoA synthetase [Euryarchaeota archaeon]